MSSNSSPGGLPEFMFEASRSDLAAREVRFMRSGGGSAYPIVSASGLSIDLFPNWPLLPGTAACLPPDNAAPVHHGVGASVNSLLPLATDLGSCVGEPVVVTGGALVLPVQGSMFDVFEAAQSSKAVSPAGLDQVEGEPQPSVEEASPPEYTASFPSEPQTESESGRSRGVGRERPAGLSAAIDELRRFCKKTQGPGDEPDWKRLKVSEEFILELALRALAAQSREGIARDMGITASMAANRVSRLDIMRRRRKLVDEFNIEAALENLATSGLVARTCKGLKRLFFVRKGDSRRFCRDWDKIQKRREKGDGRKEVEKTAAQQTSLKLRCQF